MGNMYQTQPPVSNYAGAQPQPDIKPPPQDMNQPTKPISQSYGMYGYPQQPNTFPGQGQNYQHQMQGQQGVPMGPGSYPKPTGQPEQYGAVNAMVHGYRQPQNGTVPTPNQGTQQPSVTGSTVYSPQASYQAGQLPSQSGSPYNQSLSWVPTQHLQQQSSQAPRQPYNPNYQGAPQPYLSPYSTNATPYALHARNVGNEYGQNHQPGQTLSPLPNFPLTGSPSDMHIKNINRILQQTSALVPQVEQFKGKRGRVLPNSTLPCLIFHQG
jgi:hypothetical protein